MRSLANIMSFLCHIWFYTMIGITTLVFFPALLVTTSSDRYYHRFFWIARAWAKIIIYGSGFRYQVTQEEVVKKEQGYVIIANHTSTIDIMLTLAVIPNPFVFIGKKELAKIPIFGYFYKQTSILVDRSSMRSKKEVYYRAQKKLKEGVSICIYPEGGVPDDFTLDLAAFKDGAFLLAIEHQIPIIPLTFGDNKRRLPYSFFKGVPGLLRVKMHSFLPTEGLTLDDKNTLKKKAYQLIRDQLLLFKKS